MFGWGGGEWVGGGVVQERERPDRCTVVKFRVWTGLKAKKQTAAEGEFGKKNKN